MDFLAKTKFVLCPRGFGVSSFRLFEAMKACRVPVVISDRYVFPTGIDWDSCSLTVKERDTNSIPELIRANMHRWRDMAVNARQVWEDNFSNNAFLDYMAKNIEEMNVANLDTGSGEQIRHLARVVSSRLEMEARPTLGRVKQGLLNGIKGVREPR